MTEPTAAQRRSLPPYPSGWYVLAFAAELRPGTVLSRTLAGHEIVLFRTQYGIASALDAYCPHLGAHMGRGGRVCGESLRCPFHGFQFDPAGRCVATGYGSKPPPAARLRAWPLRERNGMLQVYFHPAGAAPSWEVPVIDDRGWSAPFYRRYVIAAHPQETTENSVDLGHFSWVHGYRAVTMQREVRIDGHYLSTCYTAQRPAPLVGDRLRFHFNFETHIYGLGYSMVDVRVHGFDIHARLWVLPSPMDGEHIALYLAASGDGAGDVHRWLGWIPPRLRAALIGRGLLFALATDASQDFEIWRHKRYVHPPALALGDGPIGKYRAWATQFYDTAPAAAAPGPTLTLPEPLRPAPHPAHPLAASDATHDRPSEPSAAPRRDAAPRVRAS
jgi:nitrite reductase/ring-hydroxylating ferredoxin subunit